MLHEMAEEDWRIGFAEIVRGCSFRLKNYYRLSEEWDHDHCVACWAKFMLAERCLTRGYAVTEDYKHGLDYVWVCPTCFADLQEIMEWKIVPDESTSLP